MQQTGQHVALSRSQQHTPTATWERLAGVGSVLPRTSPGSSNGSLEAVRLGEAVASVRDLEEAGPAVVRPHAVLRPLQRGCCMEETTRATSRELQVLATGTESGPTRGGPKPAFENITACNQKNTRADVPRPAELTSR